jgi:hypothetical protein
MTDNGLAQAILALKHDYENRTTSADPAIERVLQAFDSEKKMKGLYEIIDQLEAALNAPLPKVEHALSWATRQGYYAVQDAAREYGDAHGREMYLDDDLYNNWAWRDAGEKKVSRDGTYRPPYEED